MPVQVDHIVDALASLGGEAHLDKIEERVRGIAPEPHPIDMGASIRARIQERCAQARSYKGGDDLFVSVHGVDQRRGIWRLKMDPLSPGEPDSFQDGADALMDDDEGRAQLRIHLRRERSQRLVKALKAGLTSFECQACGFDFGEKYGDLGRGYIEAHHTIPVASLEDGQRTRLSDLIALCANCHRVTHRNNLIDWRDLKRRLSGEPS
jgi:predicted HNH restriction endonuclease